MKQLITASRARSARACMRRHHLRYNEGIVPVHDDPGPRRFGSLVHTGSEHWGLAQLADKPPLRAGFEAMQTAWEEHENADPYELERALVLLEAYDARWRGDVEFVAVEVEFRMPLVNPATGSPSRLFDVGGKIDAIVRDVHGSYGATGALYVLEHKTTTLDASPGSDYWARLRLDSQLSIYVDGAQYLGFDVVGSIYDVLVRPIQRPLQATPEADRKYTKGKQCKACKGDGGMALAPDCADCSNTGWAEPPRLYANQRTEDETPGAFGDRIRKAIAENPDAWFRRGVAVRLGDELDDARRDTWAVAQRIREAQRGGHHDRNDHACFEFGVNSKCGYFGACTGEQDLSNPYLFERKAPHAELSTATTSERGGHHVEDASRQQAGIPQA